MSQLSGGDAELQAAADVRVNLALPTRANGEGQFHESDGPGVERSGLLGRLAEAAVGFPDVRVFSGDRIDNGGQGLAGHQLVSWVHHMVSGPGRTGLRPGWPQCGFERGRPGKQDIVFLVDMTVQVDLEARKAVVEGLE